MSLDEALLASFHRALVGQIRRTRPTYLEQPFAVSEIYQDLVPYRTHRNVIGVAMNGDYEDVLLRLLAGEGGYLVLESVPAIEKIRKELETSNPNTAIFRQFSTLNVRLNPELLDSVGNGQHEPVPVSDLAPDAEGAETETAEPQVQAHDGPDAPAPDEAVIAVAVDSYGEEPVGEAVADGHEEQDGEVAVGASEPEAEVDAASTDVEAEERAVPNGQVGAPQEQTRTDPDEEGVGPVCGWCSEGLPDRPGVHYCPHCGTSLHVVPCGSCGEALESTWRFCIACGVEVATP